MQENHKSVAKQLKTSKSAYLYSKTIGHITNTPFSISNFYNRLLIVFYVFFVLFLCICICI